MGIGGYLVDFAGPAPSPPPVSPPSSGGSGSGWGAKPFGGGPWGDGGVAQTTPNSVIRTVYCKDLRHVWLFFDSTVPDTALQPSAYSFVAQAVPSYNPVVTSARFINSRGTTTNSVIELFVNNDLSPGLQYAITISGLIGVPDATAIFTSYSPNWPATRNFDLWDFIPPINKAEDTSQDLEKFVLVIQDQLDTTLASIDNWTDILDPDRAPTAFLDAMLADLGNPFRFADIFENDKRLLAQMLVPLYKLKGTAPGIQDAIRFFMGFDSQLLLFRQTGSLLGSATVPIDLLNQSFVLGGGGPFDFALQVATTDPPGRALTATEQDRIQKIVNVVKYAAERFKKPIFYGLASSSRVEIAGNTASMTVTWKQISPQPDTWRVYYRLNAPGVSPFNSARYTEVTGSTTTATISTPVGSDPALSTYYTALVPYYLGKEGFVSDVEVVNNLGPPTGVTATPGPRLATVTWSPVVGATSYRVYKTLATTAGSSTPVVADYVFDVLGGATTFTDSDLFPGTGASYCVVARSGDSEGFYSASVSATPL
jgi:phage tail-like protein